jgi:hypothetical protein
MPNYREIATRWVLALREAYAGRDVRDSLEQAADEIDSLTTTGAPA